MIVAVTNYGTRLNKRNGLLEITEKTGDVRSMPFQNVNEIILSVPCSLTSEVISSCTQRGISISMTDLRGTPLWRVEPFQGGSVPLLRRKQLLLSQFPESGTLIQALLGRKLAGQAGMLRKLAANRRDERGRRLREESGRIKGICDKISALPRQPIANMRQTLLGYEGTAGRVYFAALSALLPDEAEFRGRERGGTAGAFNQMLNYGYGILYRELLSLCGRARLDPYIGVMHTDGWNRPTLVYDLIEPFRIDVEQAVFFLFSRKRVHAEIHFEKTEQGHILSKEGKQLLMEAVHRACGGGYKNDMEHLVAGFAKGLTEWKAGEGVSDDLVGIL